MAENSEIAIYISIGSLAVSIFGFLFSIRQFKANRRIERAKVYDKVYHDACDLLIYHYKNKLEEPFVSEDKDLEKAVNEFENVHWLEQMYGYNTYIPSNIKDEEEQHNFRRMVSETYYEFQKEKDFSSFDEFINYQSPVFHLENKEFSERFYRLIAHVTENLSSFSPVIVERWEKMRMLGPEKVKTEYLALKRINENSCEKIDEHIEDPYLQLLLSIRHEYRELNKPFKIKWSEFWCSVGNIKYKIKRLFNKERQ